MQLHAFAVVANPASIASGKRMGASAYSVFVFEKVRLFFGRMRLRKESRNTVLSAFDAAASAQSDVHFILGDELVYPRNIGHLRGIFPPGQG